MTLMTDGVERYVDGSEPSEEEMSRPGYYVVFVGDHVDNPGVISVGPFSSDEEAERFLKDGEELFGWFESYGSGFSSHDEALCSFGSYPFGQFIATVDEFVEGEWPDGIWLGVDQVPARWTDGHWKLDDEWATATQ
jgi:hypothetical protein